MQHQLVMLQMMESTLNGECHKTLVKTSVQNVCNSHRQTPPSS